MDEALAVDGAAPPTPDVLPASQARCTRVLGG